MVPVVEAATMRKALFAPIALMCILHTSNARPCGIATPQGSYARLSHEDTLLVWDDQKKIEHFIRRPIFDGNAKSFGFFVPTPVTPEIAKMDAAVFDRLEAIVQPKQPHGKNDDGIGGGRVDVTQTLKIDQYEIVSLKASDENALGEWLKSHAYVDRPELRAWAKSYVEKGFIINAMKLAGSEKQTDIEPPTLRFSFPIAEPFYPYSEPSEDPQARAKLAERWQRSPIGMPPRSLDLWIVARRPMQGTIAGKTSGPILAKSMRVTQLALASALGDTHAFFDSLTDKSWVITHLSERTYARPAGNDLVLTAYDIPKPTPGPGIEGFVPVREIADTAPIQEQPKHHSKRWAVLALALLLALAAIFALRSD